MGFSADTVHNNIVQSDMVDNDTDNNSVVCKSYHETAKLHCGHYIKHIVADANTANLVQSVLRLHPGIA